MLPGSKVPTLGFWNFLPIDKIVHLGLYGVLSFLFCLDFRKQYLSSELRFYGIAIALSFLYGIVNEGLQLALTVDRSFEIGDVIANGLGAVLGSMAYRWKKRNK